MPGDGRRNPFPGLRPFDSDEKHLFFGRDGQVEELLARLRGSRFVAVLGSSGSGKSSLVKAGLLPSLHGGFMAGAGSRWRVASLRPREDPIGNLAVALREALDTGDAAHADIEVALIEATLHRSANGLVQAVRESDLAAKENLLILVDQFEELFRFKQADERRRRADDRRSGLDRRSGAERRRGALRPRSLWRWRDRRGGSDRRSPNDRRVSAHRPYYEDEAAEFVKLLLEATRQRELPIFVVITMRSDFLGDCAQFRDLPEAINGGQYLVPRMTRDQRRMAITGPVAVGGAEMRPSLVQRLLNDVGDDPDQLPILQHALMRTWDVWSASDGRSAPIGLEHYQHQDIGGLERALSKHADQALGELSPKLQRLARKVFSCLTEKGPDNRALRRPAKLREICQVVEADREDVLTVIETFRRPGRSFLTPRSGEALDDDSTIDISHESLIRNWDRLRSWVEDEARSADIYWRLADAADRYYGEYDRQPEALYRGPQLQIALEWRQREKPTKAWAARYHPLFSRTMAFLDESKAARTRKRLFSIATAATVVVFLSAAALYANGKRRYAEEANRGVANTDWRQSVDLIGEDRAPEALAYLARALKFNPSHGPAGRLLANAFRYKHWPLPVAAGRHGDAVVSVRFSPDGNRFVTAASDSTARVWSAETGAPVGDPLRHGGPVVAASFSPDGRWVVTASRDGRARVWEAESGALRNTLPHGADVIFAAFSADGTRLVTASDDHTARIWDAEIGVPVGQPLSHADKVRTAEFSPDGRRVVTASFDKSARVWNAETGGSISVLKHGAGVVCASFSPDGRWVVTASRDGTAGVWDAESGARRDTLHHADAVIFAAFSPDGRWVVTTSFDSTARIWNAATGASVGEPLRHGGPVVSATFDFVDSKETTSVLTASDDRTARVWSTETGRALSEPMVHPQRVLAGGLSPNGARAVTGTADGAVQIWDVRPRSGPSRPLVHGDRVNVAEFSPDGSRVVTASRDGSAQVWSTETGESVGQPLRHGSDVISARFSADGQRVVTASRDGSARVWEAGTGDPVGAPMRYQDWVTAAVFSPDGRRVATASRDGSARVWQADTGDPLSAPMRHDASVEAVAFSPDGKWVVTASQDGSARVWQADTGDPISGPIRHEAPVEAVTFSPDGRSVATASQDGSARIWEAETGQPVGRPFLHENFVVSVDFSPDGKRLLTSSLDRTARLWDVETGSAIGAPMRHGGAVRSARFNRDGSLVVTASDDGTTRVWEAATGWPAGPELVHGGRVRSAEFGPSGMRVVSASDDHSARVWDVGIVQLGGVEELVVVAPLIGGYAIDDSGRLDVLSFAERIEARRALRPSFEAECGGRDRLRRILCRFLD